MDAEKTIAEIEWLEHLFTLPDNRLVQEPDEKAAHHCPIFGPASPGDPLCTRCGGLPRDMFDDSREESPLQMVHYYWVLCVIAALILLVLCLLIR
jgi:hypothetical protein